jgi:hypothetical protein
LSTNVLNGAFYSLQYDVLNDFVPVAPLVTNPIILFARKTLPANDLRELVAWLKANPNRASAGIQTGPASAREIDYEAKTVMLAGRRYIVCRNRQEAEKDAADRASIVAALERQLAKGDKALVGNTGYQHGKDYCQEMIVLPAGSFMM